MNKIKKGLSEEASAKKKSGGKKFNFIDLLIILALLLLVAIVINIFSPRSWFGGAFSKDTQTIQYTVEFLGVDREFVDKIAENDNVVDAVSKFSLGSVTTIDNSTHYRELQYNEETGTGGFTTYQDRYNVLVTVTVSAEYAEGEGYSVNDRRIAVGEKLYLRFPNYVGEGYCVGISAIN